MEKQKNIPQLRFPDFYGQWENRRLDEFLEFKNGINALKEQYGSGYKYISVLDILNNDFITYDKIIGSVDVHKEVINKYPVNYGDILFQRSSETREEVGTASVYLDKDKTATFGGFVIRGRKIGEYEPVFLNKLLKTDLSRNQITSKSGGSTRYNVGQDILSSIILPFPTLPEQQKIASFFTAIDHKISQLKRKLTLLEQYKKGVMQLIFSQQIRFKDDNAQEFPKWDKKKLGEVATFSKGKGISISDTSLEGTTECIRYGELYTYYGITIDEVKSRTNINSDFLVLSEANDVIIPASGETQIDIAIASCVLRTGIALGGDLNIIRGPNNGVFLSYYLNNKKKKEIANLAQGISVVHLYSRQLSSLEIEIPTLPEQTKIANFLSSIDNKINHTRKQIDKVDVWKKGLMQQMFV